MPVFFGARGSSAVRLHAWRRDRGHVRLHGFRRTSHGHVDRRAFGFNCRQRHAVPARGDTPALRLRCGARAGPAMITHAADPIDDTRIAGWVDDIAGHAGAADAIAALGDAAIPGLHAYLQSDPQVIPQPRCFAVAMLARIHGATATEALRATLHAHPLHGLSPLLAESECVVKNAAMEALADRDYPQRQADVAVGIGERLRAAVAAAGRLRTPHSADALVALLDDDVLAESAAAALAMLDGDAADAIVARLDAWTLEAAWSARRRIALLRALLVLAVLRAAVPATSLEHLLHVEHPAIQAAAALLAGPRRRDAGTARKLIHGAVAFDWALADRCRAALHGSARAAHAAAVDALRQGAEPDLYGSMRALTSGQTDWLRRFAAAGGEPRTR